MRGDTLSLAAKTMAAQFAHPNRAMYHSHYDLGKACARLRVLRGRGAPSAAPLADTTMVRDT